jgi:dGTPase
MERRVAEPPKRAGRTEFQRDRARVLHSAALRRLAGKTQVVPVAQSDFPRTRLTHSLECAQIGRELGAALGCDPDLVDAACLAHDLGHPPFGHNGETALAAVWGEGKAGGGGFEGNAQSLRLLTRLEPKVPGAGLNLTRATLDATLKYPWVGAVGKCGAYPEDAETFAWIRDGAPEGRRCLEAQVMDWADDVAYSVHDLEDGLDGGLISIKTLHTSRDRVTHTALTDYCHPEWAASEAELSEVFGEFLALDCWQFEFDGGPSARAAAKNLTSELVGRFCRAPEEATLAAAASAPDGSSATMELAPTGQRRQSGGPRAGVPGGAGWGGLRRYAADLVVPRRQLLECALLKAVTAEYVMRRKGAAASQARERELIAELASAVALGAPGTLDPLMRSAWDAAQDDAARRRVIIDQIASLTDTSAVAWHRRLCRLGLRAWRT